MAPAVGRAEKFWTRTLLLKRTKVRTFEGIYYACKLARNPALNPSNSETKRIKQFVRLRPPRSKTYAQFTSETSRTSSLNLGDGLAHGRGLGPVHGGEDEALVHVVLVLDYGGEQRLEDALLHQVGLEAEVLKLRVLGVGVVLLKLCAGVGHVYHLGIEAQLLASLGDERGELVHAELLGELVVNLRLAGGRRVVARDLDALARVGDVQEATGLAALAVHGHGVAHGGH